VIPISTQLSLRNWYIDESTKEKVFGDETKFYLAKKDLNFKHKRAKGVFHLYDMNGKLVLLQTVNGNTSIEAEILKSGIYLYKYIEGNRTDTGKILKKTSTQCSFLLSNR